MRRRALTMAILLGALTLAGTAEVRATPAFSATVVIEGGAVQKVAGDHFRSRHGFHHSRRIHKSFDRHRGFARHKGFSPRHQYGNRHYGGKWYGKHSRVIVRPAHGRSLHRHLPARPLIKNGGFARRSFHWRPYRR